MAAYGAVAGVSAGIDDFAEGNYITGATEVGASIVPFLGARRMARGPAQRPCKCFTEDTEVWTPSGLVPIAQIKAGDKVHCTAPDGEWGTCAVIAPYSREYFGEIVALTVAGEIIQVTGGHPFG